MILNLAAAGNKAGTRNELLDTDPYQSRATGVVVRYLQQRRKGGRDTATAIPEELDTSRFRQVPSRRTDSGRRHHPNRA